MFKTILVATDGSDHADKAVAVAGDLAAKYDAKMILLHVFLRRNAEATDLRRLIDVQVLPYQLREEFERFESMQEQRRVSASTVVAASIPLPEDVLVGVGLDAHPAGLVVDDSRTARGCAANIWLTEQLQGQRLLQQCHLARIDPREPIQKPLQVGLHLDP